MTIDDRTMKARNKATGVLLDVIDHDRHEVFDETVEFFQNFIIRNWTWLKF